MGLLRISNSYNNPVILTHLTNVKRHHHHHHHHCLYPPAAAASSSLRLFSSVNLRGDHGRTMLRCSKTESNSETQQPPQQEEAEDYELVSRVTSAFNDIMIVDSPTSRMLILDSTFNIHSILYKDKKWTDCYWDEFGSLPPIVPKGPIAILGLGGGTAAHLMLNLWPELQLEGWEIDPILIERARVYFWLSDLEKPTKAGGVLNVHVGDALSPDVNIPGGYAGIVVDLFANGDVLPQLKEVTTWLDLKNRLMPNGRIMVNCGGSAELDSTISSSMVQNSTIKALSKAFPGELSWKRMPKENGANYMALTGPIPDLESWSFMVQGPLSAIVKDWTEYEF